jgi:hypothetical protein
MGVVVVVVVVVVVFYDTSAELIQSVKVAKINVAPIIL